MNKSLISAAAILLTACGSLGLNAPSATMVVEYLDPPAVGRTAAGQEIFLGGFSGLVFHRKTADNHFRFLVLTDRGPNTMHIESPEGKLRPFLIPGYTPRVVELDVDFVGKKISVIRQVLAKTEVGELMNGLPTDLDQEIPVDLKGARLNVSSKGVDSEALVRMPDSTFWVAEEYEPSLLHFYSDGKLIGRYSTKNAAIPQIFTKRRTNLGFEALAYSNGMLYAFLQASVKKDSRAVRVLEFDPWRKKAKRQFIYVLEADDNLVGDAVAKRDGKIYVLERDRKVGSQSFKRVYEVTIGAATDVTKLGSVEDSMENVKPVSKRLLLDLAANGLDRWEKAEGLAIVDDLTLGVVTDNDFNLDGTLDTKTGLANPAKAPSAFLLFSIPK